jgi:tetratricopeptide (TPR) repeat protein
MAHAASIPDAPVDVTREKPATSGASADEAQLLVLREGIDKLRSGRTKEAIVNHFDKIIEHYESRHNTSDQRIYTARSQAEALMYMVTAAQDKQSAIVLRPIWSDALYAKAYALIELRNTQEAKHLLDRAISMSPRNAQYLAELGHVHQLWKEWDEALAVFKSAEQAARDFSPQDAKTMELTRALRGSGYVLIELGRLDKAEDVYRRCLELDASDSRARNQLQYIQSIRTKAPSR